jgi:hypothetical protein
MVDTHQSYEDFHLDALLQFDLVDDDDDNYNADTDSIHSDVVDEAAFHELYESIPDVICDTNDNNNKNYNNNNSNSKLSITRSTKLRNVTKMIRRPRLQQQVQRLTKSTSCRSIQSDDDYIMQIGKSTNTSKPKSCTKKNNLIQSVGKILLPKRPLKTTSSNDHRQRSSRGIVRNVSCRTEGSTVSWVSDDLSRTMSNIRLIEEDVSSSSKCYLDDEEDDNESNCCSEVFVDECYKVMMNNSNNNSIDSLNNDDDCDVEEKTSYDDRFLNRSLPIIESRGLQSLFFDSDTATNNNNNNSNKNIETSTDDDTSEERYDSGRRQYTISEF